MNDCLLFLLLLNENSITPDSSCLNCGFYIKNSLYRILFQDTCLNSNTKSLTNLLIATYDGYLYNLRTDHVTENNDENNPNILLTTLSSIIYLDVFMMKDKINSLFEKTKAKSKRIKIYNSLFLVTSNGVPIHTHS